MTKQTFAQQGAREALKIFKRRGSVVVPAKVATAMIPGLNRLDRAGWIIRVGEQHGNVKFVVDPKSPAFSA